jgi:predicted transposase YdaD
MPYVTSVERLAKEEGREEGRQEGRQEGRRQGRQEGLLSGIGVALMCKFGDAGRKLIPGLKRIKDPDRLESFAQAIESAENLSALRRLLR